MTGNPNGDKKSKHVDEKVNDTECCVHLQIKENITSECKENDLVQGPPKPPPSSVPLEVKRDAETSGLVSSKSCNPRDKIETQGKNIIRTIIPESSRLDNTEQGSRRTTFIKEKTPKEAYSSNNETANPFSEGFSGLPKFINGVKNEESLPNQVSNQVHHAGSPERDVILAEQFAKTDMQTTQPQQKVIVNIPKVILETTDESFSNQKPLITTSENKNKHVSGPLKTLVQTTETLKKNIDPQEVVNVTMNDGCSSNQNHANRPSDNKERESPIFVPLRTGTSMECKKEQISDLIKPQGIKLGGSSTSKETSMKEYKLMSLNEEVSLKTRDILSINQTRARVFSDKSAKHSPTVVKRKKRKVYSRGENIILAHQELDILSGGVKPSKSETVNMDSIRNIIDRLSQPCIVHYVGECKSESNKQLEGKCQSKLHTVISKQCELPNTRELGCETAERVYLKKTQTNAYKRSNQQMTGGSECGNSKQYSKKPRCDNSKLPDKPRTGASDCKKSKSVCLKKSGTIISKLCERPQTGMSKCKQECLQQKSETTKSKPCEKPPMGGSKCKQECLQKSETVKSKLCESQPTGGSKCKQVCLQQKSETTKSKPCEKPPMGVAKCKQECLQKSETVKSKLCESQPTGGSKCKQECLQQKSEAIKSKPCEKPSVGGSKCKQECLQKSETVKSKLCEGPQTGMSKCKQECLQQKCETVKTKICKRQPTGGSKSKQECLQQKCETVKTKLCERPRMGGSKSKQDCQRESQMVKPKLCKMPKRELSQQFKSTRPKSVAELNSFCKELNAKAKAKKLHLNSCKATEQEFPGKIREPKIDICIQHKIECSENASGQSKREQFTPKFECKKSENLCGEAKSKKCGPKEGTENVCREAKSVKCGPNEGTENVCREAKSEKCGPKEGTENVYREAKSEKCDPKEGTKRKPPISDIKDAVNIKEFIKGIKESFNIPVLRKGIKESINVANICKTLNENVKIHEIIDGFKRGVKLKGLLIGLKESVKLSVLLKAVREGISLKKMKEAVKKSIDIGKIKQIITQSIKSVQDRSKKPPKDQENKNEGKGTCKKQQRDSDTHSKKECGKQNFAIQTLDSLTIRKHEIINMNTAVQAFAHTCKATYTKQASPPDPPDKNNIDSKTALDKKDESSKSRRKKRPLSVLTPNYITPTLGLIPPTQTKGGSHDPTKITEIPRDVLPVESVSQEMSAKQEDPHSYKTAAPTHAVVHPNETESQTTKPQITFVPLKHSLEQQHEVKLETQHQQPHTGSTETSTLVSSNTHQTDSKANVHPSQPSEYPPHASESPQIPHPSHIPMHLQYVSVLPHSTYPPQIYIYPQHPPYSAMYPQYASFPPHVYMHPQYSPVPSQPPYSSHVPMHPQYVSGPPQPPHPVHTPAHSQYASVPQSPTHPSQSDTHPQHAPVPPQSPHPPHNTMHPQHSSALPQPQYPSHPAMHPQNSPLPSQSPHPSQSDTHPQHAPVPPQSPHPPHNTMHPQHSSALPQPQHPSHPAMHPQNSPVPPQSPHPSQSETHPQHAPVLPQSAHPQHTAMYSQHSSVLPQSQHPSQPTSQPASQPQNSPHPSQSETHPQHAPVLPQSAHPQHTAIHSQHSSALPQSHHPSQPAIQPQNSPVPPQLPHPSQSETHPQHAPVPPQSPHPPHTATHPQNYPAPLPYHTSQTVTHRQHAPGPPQSPPQPQYPPHPAMHPLNSPVPPQPPHPPQTGTHPQHAAVPLQSHHPSHAVIHSQNVPVPSQSPPPTHTDIHPQHAPISSQPPHPPHTINSQNSSDSPTSPLTSHPPIHPQYSTVPPQPSHTSTNMPHISVPPPSQHSSHTVENPPGNAYPLHSQTSVPQSIKPSNSPSDLVPVNTAHPSNSTLPQQTSTHSKSDTTHPSITAHTIPNPAEGTTSGPQEPVLSKSHNKPHFLDAVKNSEQSVVERSPLHTNEQPLQAPKPEQVVIHPSEVANKDKEALIKTGIPPTIQASETPKPFQTSQKSQVLVPTSHPDKNINDSPKPSILPTQGVPAAPASTSGMSESKTNIPGTLVQGKKEIKPIKSSEISKAEAARRLREAVRAEAIRQSAKIEGLKDAVKDQVETNGIVLKQYIKDNQRTKESPEKRSITSRELSKISATNQIVKALITFYESRMNQIKGQSNTDSKIEAAKKAIQESLKTESFLKSLRETLTKGARKHLIEDGVQKPDTKQVVKNDLKSEIQQHVDRSNLKTERQKNILEDKLKHEVDRKESKGPTAITEDELRTAEGKGYDNLKTKAADYSIKPPVTADDPDGIESKTHHSTFPEEAKKYSPQFQDDSKSSSLMKQERQGNIQKGAHKFQPKPPKKPVVKPPALKSDGNIEAPTEDSLDDVMPASLDKFKTDKNFGKVFAPEDSKPEVKEPSKFKGFEKVSETPDASGDTKPAIKEPQYPSPDTSKAPIIEPQKPEDPRPPSKPGIQVSTKAEEIKVEKAGGVGSPKSGGASKHSPPESASSTYISNNGDVQLTGLSRYFNSQTIRGRANVSKLTFALLGVGYLYYVLRPKPKDCDADIPK